MAADIADTAEQLSTLAVMRRSRGLKPGEPPPLGSYLFSLAPTPGGIRLARPSMERRDTGPLGEAVSMIYGHLNYDNLPSPLPFPVEDPIADFAPKTLLVPYSDRWREAVSTALIGGWSAPLWETGYLSATALAALRAEVRSLHRGLVPVWRRRTRSGRVLSLDAGLGGVLSLYDLVAADVDLLAHTADGVFDDERLNAVLGSLDPAERRVVFAYAKGEGTTWTEAATVVGNNDPEAFGERVRRKAKRLAKEQGRRFAELHARNGAKGGF
ncbi:hypothetical protein [Streptomyces olivochromogenes]|uniref:hypothetical protein n=1 Tax=Streptomyces olivochromogenes TaxID=1963 RepID=UPI0036B6B0FA